MGEPFQLAQIYRSCFRSQRETCVRCEIDSLPFSYLTFVRTINSPFTFYFLIFTFQFPFPFPLKNPAIFPNGFLPSSQTKMRQIPKQLQNYLHISKKSSTFAANLSPVGGKYYGPPPLPRWLFSCPLHCLRQCEDSFLAIKGCYLLLSIFTFHFSISFPPLFCKNAPQKGTFSCTCQKKQYLCTSFMEF